MGIRCSRCDQVLGPEAFAPSHRIEGDWCRSCRKAYMAKRNARLRALRDLDRDTRIRTCKRCGVEFIRWDNAKHEGGDYSRHCQDCYNAKARDRSYVNGKAKAPKQPPREPTLDYRPQGRQWQTLRASVIAEETHCGICGEPVDKTLTGTQPAAPSVDHIIPVTQGGSYYDRTNLRLAHFGCNGREGARLANHKRWQLLYGQALEQIATLEGRIKELESFLLKSSRA